MAVNNQALAHAWLGQVTASVGAVGYALGVEHNPEPLGGELNPEVSQLPEGEEALELAELGAVGLSVAQVPFICLLLHFWQCARKQLSAS